MSVGYYLCAKCGESHPITSSAVCPNQFSKMVVRADTVTRPDQPAADVRVVTVEQLEWWADTTQSGLVSSEIRAIIDGYDRG